MRTPVLVGVLGFTTNQGIQDGGQRVANAFQCMNAGLQEVYSYRELSNYEIKGKFASALHVTDNSAQITIILGPKEALRNWNAI